MPLLLLFLLLFHPLSLILLIVIDIIEQRHFKDQFMFHSVCEKHTNVFYIKAGNIYLSELNFGDTLPRQCLANVLNADSVETGFGNNSESRQAQVKIVGRVFSLTAFV